MDNSPLSSLPPELLNSIYEYALTQPEPIIVTTDIETNKLQMTEQSAIKKPMALLSVCKQINNETRLMFYHLNTFSVRANDSKSPPLDHNEANIARRFFNAIGPKRLAAIGGFHILTRRAFPILAYKQSAIFPDFMPNAVRYLSRILSPLRRLARRLRPNCVVQCQFRWAINNLGPCGKRVEHASSVFVDLKDLRKALQEVSCDGWRLPISPKLYAALMAELDRQESREAADADTDMIPHD